MGHNHFFLPFLYAFRIFIPDFSFLGIYFPSLARPIIISFLLPSSLSFKLKQFPHLCSYILLSISYFDFLPPFLPHSFPSHFYVRPIDIPLPYLETTGENGEGKYDSFLLFLGYG
jgi:hypothetical protein